MARFGNFDQYLDNAGDPLSDGKLYFYESGTTTPKTTFSDVNNSIANTNPVLLSAAGRQPNIFFDGVAKVILTDKNDVQIAVRDPVGETATDFGDEWVASKIYSSNDVVLGSDGVYYRSLVNGNQNNNPVTSSGFWTLLYSVEWNSGITYDVGAVVTYNNQQYQSLQASNIGNNPASATAWWVPLNFAWVATATYSLDQNVVGTDGILYTSLQNSNTGNDPATSPAYWVGTSAAAAASATAAAASATAASASETAAATSATNAAASESAAATSATNSANSATASAASATASAASAAAAATSETNAATSASDSATSASQSATSATASAASATAALASETAAAASETAAAASESAAATSATNAATSATASATSATNSANSATASASSATDSANSATASAGSATAAAGSATSAAGSATAAAGSATSAATSASDAAATYDAFDDRYLGEKGSDPATDNDGNPLITGALYFNNVSNVMRVYTGSAWTNVAPTATSVTVAQISDLDTNLDDFLVTPSSANLATAVTDETGSGSLVFATSPTLVTPVLGTPTSGNLSNCTADGTNDVGTSNVSPVGTKTTSYTLQTGDVGKYVQLGTGGAITIPNATFSEGDAISIFNNTTGNITITCSITTAYISGTNTDVASVTLATRGVCTILFISSTVCVISGSVA